jgi:hypothetical protein
MSKVPLPERGQPLDLSYIYQLANSINEIASELSPTVGRYTTVETVSAGKQNIRTSDARIIGGYVFISNNSTTSPDSEATFSYTFTDFQYAPIVTATPILTSGSNTDAGKDVSVILTQVTPGRVDGIVKFNTIGLASVGVNIIAVGIPV